MFKRIKRIDSTNETVSKFIFEMEDAIAEAVLYTYGSSANRTVICCSVMSGCPVGCRFCGTGKKFIRNLKAQEIVDQVTEIVNNVDPNLDANCAKFQIMFMSMGEPMLNWGEVELAIRALNTIYPNAQLLISTVGINDIKVFKRVVQVSKEIDKVGLQFSIHDAYDSGRDYLIPYGNKWRLSEIRDAGLYWWKETGRPVYLNYCVDSINSDERRAFALMNMFSPIAFNFTFP